MTLEKVKVIRVLVNVDFLYDSYQEIHGQRLSCDLIPESADKAEISDEQITLELTLMLLVANLANTI